MNGAQVGRGLLSLWFQDQSPLGQLTAVRSACSLNSVSLTHLQRPEAGAAFLGSDSPAPSVVLVLKMQVDG